MRDPMAAPGWWAERLRHLREQRGWRQEDLAVRAGITQAQISRLESGEQIDPRMTTLVGLDDAFGMTVDAMLGRGVGRSTDALSSTDENYRRTSARVEMTLRGAVA